MTVTIRKAVDIDQLGVGDSYFIAVADNEDPTGIDLDAFDALQDEVERRFSTPLSVTFGTDDKGQFLILYSEYKRTVTVGGDTRDGNVNLSAGERKERRLTGEGFGFVSVNGTRYGY